MPSDMGFECPCAGGLFRLPAGDALGCLVFGHNRLMAGRLAVAECVAQRREVAEGDLDDVTGNEKPSADESDTCGSARRDDIAGLKFDVGGDCFDQRRHVEYEVPEGGLLSQFALTDVVTLRSMC